MKYYEEDLEIQDQPITEEEPFCYYCWDKKKQKDRELFFIDATNNLRVCRFCPNCGREYSNEA